MRKYRTSGSASLLATAQYKASMPGDKYCTVLSAEEICAQNILRLGPCVEYTIYCIRVWANINRSFRNEKDFYKQYTTECHLPEQHTSKQWRNIVPLLLHHNNLWNTSRHLITFIRTHERYGSAWMYMTNPDRFKGGLCTAHTIPHFFGEWSPKHTCNVIMRLYETWVIYFN